MCEFDESNQPCITKYYNISHSLSWYCHDCIPFMANLWLKQNNEILIFVKNVVTR
jgi:hypothetical protein